ncbi:MAG: transcriptional repressor LexA [Rhodospirillales bacterium]|nr:transcriptional repressor LexA [Rhodospirillales bacterium]
MLTKKQYELLTFINYRLNETGISPSYDEMKDALDLKSKSGIHRLITALEERGFIRRLPHKARALEVLKLPENMTAGASKNTPSNVIKADFETPAEAKLTPVAANDMIELPLLGKIAAGTPIEALRDNSNTVEVPPSLLGKGEHYALEIDGDSMIEAGINDGDTVLIERCDTAENGTIVVALVDDNEVTLKRLRRKGDQIALEAANKDFETRIFGPDRVNIQGKLVALLRKY